MSNLRILLVCVGVLFANGNILDAQSFRYEDDSGNIHFVERFSQIPPQYRSQVIPSSTLPPMSDAEYRMYLRDFEKQKKQMQRNLIKEEKKRQVKKEKVGPATKARSETTNQRTFEYAITTSTVSVPDTLELKKPVNPTNIKQKFVVELFVAPNCSECSALENYLRTNKIRFKKMDIVKDPVAFKIFDSLQVGAKIPVARIGTTIIEGFQPEQIVAAAVAMNIKRPQPLTQNEGL